MRTHQSRIQNSWKVCGVPGMRGLLARPRAGQAARRGPPPQPAGAAAGVPSAPAGGRRARARATWVRRGRAGQAAPCRPRSRAGRPASPRPPRGPSCPTCAHAACRPSLHRMRGRPPRAGAALPPCRPAAGRQPISRGEGGAGWIGKGKVKITAPPAQGGGPGLCAARSSSAAAAVCSACSSSGGALRGSPPCASQSSQKESITVSIAIVYTWRRARAAITTFALPYTCSSTTCVTIMYTWRARPHMVRCPEQVARARPRAGPALDVCAGRGEAC